jgi:hypothetical protein
VAAWPESHADGLWGSLSDYAPRPGWLLLPKDPVWLGPHVPFNLQIIASAVIVTKIRHEEDANLAPQSSARPGWCAQLSVSLLHFR